MTEEIQIQAEEKSELEGVREQETQFDEIVKKNDWDKNSIDEREKRLLIWVKQEWGN